MSDLNNTLRAIQVGAVDFFGILLPGLLATVTTLVGFFVPIFLFIANSTGISLPVGEPNPIIWGFIVFLLIVLSYVLGYILRLSSPDELDKISARNVILRELDRLNEHYKKHPEENKDKQDYEVNIWFRLILLHHPTVRKIARLFFNAWVTNEENKFSTFVLQDAWPYNPDEPLDKYPYFNFYWYLEHRGHTDLANLVNWGWDDEESRSKRSKTAVNRMKMDIRSYCPPLAGSLESKEGHVRLMAGTWTAFKIASPLVILALILASIVAFRRPELRWYYIFTLINSLLLALMYYSVRRIEKLFHYRRVSELFHIVQAAYITQQIKAKGGTKMPQFLEEAE